MTDEDCEALAAKIETALACIQIARDALAPPGVVLTPAEAAAYRAHIAKDNPTTPEG